MVDYVFTYFQEVGGGACKTGFRLRFTYVSSRLAMYLQNVERACTTSSGPNGPQGRRHPDGDVVPPERGGEQLRA